MKKTQFLTKIMLLVCLACMVISCDKKDSMDDGTASTGALDITMSYSPNPATKNTPISFTFETKQSGTYKAVTMTSCDVIMPAMTGMAAKTTVMNVTEKSAGIYTGSYTFTESGTYELHFKYMYNNKDTDKDFSVTIQ